MPHETEKINYCDAIVGTNVRTVRERLGISQSQLANRMGIAHTRVSEVERGRYRLRLETVFQFAEALGVTPESLIIEPRTMNEMRKKYR